MHLALFDSRLETADYGLQDRFSKMVLALPGAKPGGYADHQRQSVVVRHFVDCEIFDVDGALMNPEQIIEGYFKDTGFKPGKAYVDPDTLRTVIPFTMREPSAAVTDQAPLLIP